MGGCKTEKTTTMVLEVDLQCCSCYKKVKKILCKFPQIKNQVYDEKANTVTITAVCCNPEKIRDKLYSKGCGVIKCIKIKEPEKPKPKPDPKPPSPIQVKVDPIQVNVELALKYPPPPQGHCCCCGQCHGRCPCYHSCGCGRGCRGSKPLQEYPPPPPGYCCCCCGECYGRCPCDHSYGCGRGCRVSKCDWYFSM